jgi:hypothetical protein
MAREPEPRFHNRALDGAFKKGRKARRQGKSVGANPYMDVRREGPKFAGRVTFSRAFWKIWKEGWEYENKNIGKK